MGAEEPNPAPALAVSEPEMGRSGGGGGLVDGEMSWCHTHVFVRKLLNLYLGPDLELSPDPDADIAELMSSGLRLQSRSRRLSCEGKLSE